jgi:hypothetical protein
MSSNNDLPQFFVQIGGIILLGGIIGAAFTGQALSFVFACFGIYAMLICVNAIQRGEIMQRKQRQKKRNQ